MVRIRPYDPHDRPALCNHSRCNLEPDRLEPDRRLFWESSTHEPGCVGSRAELQRLLESPAKVTLVPGSVNRGLLVTQLASQNR